MAPHPTVLRRLNARHLTIWSGSRPVAHVLGALAAVGLSFALVALALRRFRREPPAQVMVVEEREAVGSLRSAVGVAAARWRRRLRRRLPGRAAPTHRRRPSSCADATPNWNAGWRVPAGHGRPASPCATTSRR